MMETTNYRIKQGAKDNRKGAEMPVLHASFQRPVDLILTDCVRDSREKSLLSSGSGMGANAYQRVSGTTA
jgi:hypothetical protein